MARKLWKTEIVVWTPWNPVKVPVSRIVAAGEGGDGYIGRAHSELVSSPYQQEDGPPDDWPPNRDTEES
jgi:hypothetical protein